MKLVIDCNVVVSAALTAGTCRRVIMMAIREHSILVCAEIIGEYRSVATRNKFSTRREALGAIISAIEAVGLPVLPPPMSFNLRDPADEVYLATAIVGGADALITGNTRHFANAPVDTPQILTPRRFLDRCA